MTEPAPFLHVPDTWDAPSLARSFAAEHTAALGRQARAIVELLVSEVVTNAHKHGHPPVRIAITVRGSSVRVEVHDYGPSFAVPVITVNDLASTGGWGLAIVSALASSWGISATEWDIGKRVWFELDTAGPFPELPGITD